MNFEELLHYFNNACNVWDLISNYEICPKRLTSSSTYLVWVFIFTNERANSVDYIACWWKNYSYFHCGSATRWLLNKQFCRLVKKGFLFCQLQHRISCSIWNHLSFYREKILSLALKINPKIQAKVKSHYIAGFQ